MATAATLSSGQSAANQRIFSILQGGTNISSELREILDSAAEAFQGKSYKTAAKHYKDALKEWTKKDNRRQNQMIILIKYMLCICSLESAEAKDLLNALSTLEDLQTTNGKEYPMLYYAVAKAYFKLYCFNKAKGILKDGFSVLNSEINVVEYNIPGTNVIIPESSKDRLITALVNLKEQCYNWHRPDAVCCMPHCSKYSQNEGADKNIFFGSPTFIGMVQVSCNNPSNVCIMNFHSTCWKAKKEQLCSLEKMSDKDVLNLECFTPNCENQGVRCTVKKIEIYDENAEIKASIEPRTDDVIWHAKQNPPPKGAIRKQQQPPKVKVPSADNRTPYERPNRPQTAPNNVQTHNNTSTHRTKIEENEEDDDIDDEQALKASIEKLVELRAKNFGIKDDSIWRPNLQMYGNEYMLATAELMPDPDFTDEGIEEADIKAFFFSYFYSFISENGPVKLDVLAEKWNESKDMDANCNLVLKHYLDITEFLLQSVKFAVIGDYICVADKIPEAYELAKNDTCEILRFFMENDVDERSNSSSIDDEAVYDAVTNQEKNNNSLPYSSVLEDDRLVIKETSIISNAVKEMEIKDNEKSFSEPRKILVASSSVPSTPKMQKMQLLPKYESDVLNNDNIVAREIIEVSKTETPKKRSSQKRSHSVEYPKVGLSVKIPENEMPNRETNGIEKNRDNETIVNSPAKRNFEIQRLTKLMKESKSTNDLRASSASPTNSCNAMMSNSGEPANRSFDTKIPYFLSSPNKANGMTNTENRQEISGSPKGKQDADLVTELIEEVQKMSVEHANYKEKIQHLESEIEHVKKAHAAMTIKMLQKSLHSQYACNYSIIMRKLEECRNNADVCAGIQTMLMNLVGQNLPNCGADWSKVMTELEQIAKKHQKKFLELNDELYNTKEPENLKGVNLQLENLPEMPQKKLIDVIQLAFEFYRMHQMKEFQRMQLTMPPPKNPSIRAPQAPQMFPGQYKPPPLADYYSASQFPVHANPALAHHASKSNFLGQINAQNGSMSAQGNSGNPYNHQFHNLPAALPNFQPHYQNPYMGIPYQAQSVQTLQQINSGSLQQNFVNNATKASIETQQQKITGITQKCMPLQNITTLTQNATPTNFLAPEKLKISAQTSNLPNSRNFNNLTQQKSYDQNLSFPPRQTSSIADIDGQRNQANFNFLPPEFHTQFPRARENSSSPVQKKVTSVVKDENLEISRDLMKANKATEIPKTVIFQARENKENIEEPKVAVERKAKEHIFGEMKNSVVANLMQNWSSNILPAPLLFRDDTANVEEKKNIDTSVLKKDSINIDKTEDSTKAVEKNNEESVIVVPKEAKIRKKTEHSLDKLMRKMREHYRGILELDLLKGVEYVRKKHNNSLSGLPISRIMREADRFILDRQQKQLCGYGKRPPSQYFAVTNAATSCSSDSERKRQTSVSSTSSAGSGLKKEPQHSWTVKKQWEAVTTLNDTWNRETPESDCAICFDSMLDTDSYVLQCKHSFHKLCIKNWYQHNQSCPTCRVHSTIDDEYPPLPLG